MRNNIGDTARLKHILDAISEIETYIKKEFKAIRIIEAELAALAENAGKTYRKERKKFK